MARITTVGQIRVKKALPAEMRNEDRTLDAAGLRSLLQDLAINHPDSYRETTKKLMDLSRVVATRTGGFSFDLTHMRRNNAATMYKKRLHHQMHAILGNDNIDDAERNRQLIEAAKRVQQAQPEEIFQEELAKKSPLAYQVLSGARGNKRNLASLISGDMLYEDSKGNTIPVPITESFSEGSSPASYLASVFGARKSVIDTKLRTADAGYFGKQLNQIAHRTLVSDEDEDGQDDDDRPHYTRGMPASIDDNDNEGALLAQSVEGYDRNTVLTPKIIRSLKQKGVKRLLVRSVIAGGQADGSVYARDVGVFENGRLPTVGSTIGNPTAQATSEPVSQGSLGSKHGGGVAGATKAVSGFEALNALIQNPKIFPHGATHSEEDGAVQRVSDAPAGGKFVYINDKEHYVSPGKELLVKPGDMMEAGDVLSEGVPVPGEVTKHKGVGEGQRYWAHAMRDSMKASGLATNRRNLEVLANSLIGHVQLDDEMDGWSPDEIVPYRLIAARYRPRKDAQELEPTRALGQYLEAPVLHYSIGTKVRPSVLKTLQEFNVPNVTVHRDAPPFQPRMVRAADNLQYDEDWMTRMYGSGLKSSLLDAVHSGSTSDEMGSSFVPGLARATGFGTYGKFISKPNPGSPMGTPTSEFKTGADLVPPMEKAAHAGHGVTHCSKCDKVVRQCRCTRGGRIRLPDCPPEECSNCNPKLRKERDQFLGRLKSAGDINATPNKSITNTAPVGGHVGGGADRPGDYSTGGALSSLAESHGPAAGGGTASGLSLGAPPPVTNFNHPDYVPPSSNGGAARPGQTSNTTSVGAAMGEHAGQAEPPQPSVSSTAGTAIGGLGGTVAGQAATAPIANRVTARLNTAPVKPNALTPNWLKGRMAGGGVAGALQLGGQAFGNVVGQMWNGQPVNWGEVRDTVADAAPDAAAFALTQAAIPKGGFLPVQMIAENVKDIYDRTLGVGGEKATQNAGNAMDQNWATIRDPNAGVLQTAGAVMGSLVPTFSKAEAAYQAHQAGNAMQAKATAGANALPSANAARMQQAQAQTAQGDRVAAMKTMLQSATADAGATHTNALNNATWSRTMHPELWDKQLGMQIDLQRARILFDHGMHEDGRVMTSEEKQRLGTAISQRSAMLLNNYGVLNRGAVTDIASPIQVHKAGGERSRRRVTLRTGTN